MWRLLREGLRCYRSVLLISWAFAVGIFLLVIAVIGVVGSVKDLADLQRSGVQLPLAILIASMVAGFITLGTERGEERLRMHLSLPVPLAQVALARVLLPAALVLVGLAVGHLVSAGVTALDGSSGVLSGHLMLDFVAVQLLFWLQLALAVREIVELRRRMGWAGALGPKALLAVVIALMVLIQLGPWQGLPIRTAAAAGLVALVAGFTVALFVRRTQFTR